jgi:hypothetical protein
MTFRARISGGTIAVREAFVEQVPANWITCDGSSVPRKGEVVRIVHAHRADENLPALIRVDRTATTVWTKMRREESGGG